jgi:methyl-accepting chemotaxis protein
VSRPFRRRPILSSAFQYRLFAANLLSWGAIVLILAVVVLLPLMLQLRSSSTVSPTESEEAAIAFLLLHARLWPALFLILGLLAFQSVMISRRVAGPLYQFQHVLRTVAEGDLSVRATIRTTDYLTKEAEVINEMIEALTKRITGIEAQSTALRAAFSDLRSARTCGSEEALDKHLESFGVRLDELRACVSQFRVATPIKKK